MKATHHLTLISIESLIKKAAQNRTTFFGMYFRNYYSIIIRFVIVPSLVSIWNIYNPGVNCEVLNW